MKRAISLCLAAGVILFIVLFSRMTNAQSSTAEDIEWTDSWVMNETGETAAIFSNIEVNVTSVTVEEIDGKQYQCITASGIPSYQTTITQQIIDALNSRPNAATDFANGSTTLSVGDVVDFGGDVGFTPAAGCTSGNEGYGYWPKGPSCPTDQAKIQCFPLDPEPTTDVCSTGLNDIGTWVNGVALFNWQDGQSYNNDGVWVNEAFHFEYHDLDIDPGHSANGNYHHHSNPVSLGEQLGDDGTAHSTIYGFAADGYPIHGPWQGDGELANSCWKVRDYEDVNSLTGCGVSGERSCLLVDSYDITQGTEPAGSNGPATTDIVTSQSGNPFVTTSGYYFQDYYYDSSCSDQGIAFLDEHNGHDHDDLGYHYHVTISDNGDGTYTDEFPFYTGPTYNGILESNAIASCGSDDSGGAPGGDGPPGGDGGPPGGNGGPPVDPTPVPTVTPTIEPTPIPESEEADSYVRKSGVVEAADGTSVMVGGLTCGITADTTISGDIVVNAEIVLFGETDENGTCTALAITAYSSSTQDPDDFDHTGQVTYVTDASINVGSLNFVINEDTVLSEEINVGDKVYVQATKTASSTYTANIIELVETNVPDLEAVITVAGTATAVSESAVTVGNVIYTIDTDTTITGTLVDGVNASVTATSNVDGTTATATLVEVFESEESPVFLRGEASAVTQDSVTIGTKTVGIASDTTITGEPADGATLFIVADEASDGILTATAIYVKASAVTFATDTKSIAGKVQTFTDTIITLRDSTFAIVSSSELPEGLGQGDHVRATVQLTENDTYEVLLIELLNSVESPVDSISDSGLWAGSSWYEFGQGCDFEGDITVGDLVTIASQTDETTSTLSPQIRAATGVSAVEVALFISPTSSAPTSIGLASSSVSMTVDYTALIAGLAFLMLLISSGLLLWQRSKKL